MTEWKISGVFPGPLDKSLKREKSMDCPGIPGQLELCILLNFMNPHAPPSPLQHGWCLREGKMCTYTLQTACSA